MACERRRPLADLFASSRRLVDPPAWLQRLFACYKDGLAARSVPHIVTDRSNTCRALHLRLHSLFLFFARSNCWIKTTAAAGRNSSLRRRRLVRRFCSSDEATSRHTDTLLISIPRRSSLSSWLPSSLERSLAAQTSAEGASAMEASRTRSCRSSSPSPPSTRRGPSPAHSLSPPAPFPQSHHRRSLSQSPP